MFQNYCLSELKLTPAFLLPGRESNFPKHKTITSRSGSITEEGLIFPFQKTKTKSLYFALIVSRVRAVLSCGLEASSGLWKMNI